MIDFLCGIHTDLLAHILFRCTGGVIEPEDFLTSIQTMSGSLLTLETINMPSVHITLLGDFGWLALMFSGIQDVSFADDQTALMASIGGLSGEVVWVEWEVLEEGMVW